MKTDIYHGDAKVDEKNTVAGRLKKFTSSDSGAMKYASALGRRQAGARGLTNSSIAVGQAAEQVFRVGTDVAKSDAAIFSASNIATAQNRTQLESQRASDSAAFDRTKLTTDTQKDIQTQSDTAAYDRTKLTTDTQKDIQTKSDAAAYDRTKLTTDTQIAIQTQGDKAAKERLADQITSQEKIATQQSETQKSIQASADSAALARLTEQIGSTEAIALAERTNQMAISNAQAASALAVASERSTSAKEVAGIQAASSASINAANITSAENIADARNTTNVTISENNAKAIATENALNRLSSENITKWNNEAAVELQGLKEQYGLTSEYRSDATNAWNAFSQGIGAIDTTASPASQTEQYNRLQAAFKSQMTFLNKTRVSDLAAKGASASNADAMEAYNSGLAAGMTAEEMDAVGGVAPGTTAAWIQSMGLSPLNTVTATAAAATDDDDDDNDDGTSGTSTVGNNVAVTDGTSDGSNTYNLSGGEGTGSEYTKPT